MEETNTKPQENAGSQQQAETKTDLNEDPTFFHPVSLNEENAAIQEDQEAEKSKEETEQKLQDTLKSMNEESASLSKFMAEEAKIINELCTSLSQVLKKIHASFNIPPQDIPLQKKARKIVLNEEGNLTLTYDKNETQTAQLATYPPETVMAVLWIAIPELSRAISTYRKRLSMRAGFFGIIKRELKNISKIISESEQEKPNISSTPSPNTSTEQAKTDKQS